ncbi:MAG: DNA-3-methyladenine glycosylase 2 family protein [Betaproteobacteria bacterium]|nr:DNA-3-methyladenine glycosylase 2 family protein [Betaproteobacteria bacterium]
MATLIRQTGRHRLVPRPDPFVSLARAIVGQQLSTKAAGTIWARIGDLTGHVDAVSVATADPARLRACGLSERKLRYVVTLARDFTDGTIDPARWAAMDDEAVVTDLIRIPGIGRWTAEMFLIFHLVRPDILPLGDVGIQRALRTHYGRGRDLSARRLTTVSAPWRPWRSVASWYLWRSLDAAP